MTLVRKAQQQSFLQGLASSRDALAGVLVYGTDIGGVHELAQRTVRAILGERADDPFALVTLSEDVLKEDPGRLLDEVQSVSMFGGARVVWVRGAADAFRKAMRAVLDLPAREAFVVAEAPGLKKDSALARLFEKDKRLAALPVYADDAGDLRQLVTQVLSEHGLRADDDALLALQSLLGADRAASRNELEKLALYCHERGRVTLEDVRAVCADAAAHMMPDMLDAFFTGKAMEGTRLFASLLAEGTPGAAMLQAAANHVAKLRELRAAMARGATATEAVNRARPPVFFRRRPAMARQLGLWPEEKLAIADESIWQAMRTARAMPELEAQLAERCLLGLAMRAARPATA